MLGLKEEKKVLKTYVDFLVISPTSSSSSKLDSLPEPIFLPPFSYPPKSSLVAGMPGHDISYFGKQNPTLFALLS